MREFCGDDNLPFILAPRRWEDTTSEDGALPLPSTAAPARQVQQYWGGACGAAWRMIFGGTIMVHNIRYYDLLPIGTHSTLRFATT